MIVAAADVGDEGDLLAVGRPGGSADVASHVELLDGEVLHVLDGLALELGGVGEGSLGEGRSVVRITRHTMTAAQEGVPRQSRNRRRLLGRSAVRSRRGVPPSPPLPEILVFNGVTEQFPRKIVSAWELYGKSCGIRT